MLCGSHVPEALHIQRILPCDIVQCRLVQSLPHLQPHAGSAAPTWRETCSNHAKKQLEMYSSEGVNVPLEDGNQ